MDFTFQGFRVQMYHCTLPRCFVSAPLVCFQLLHLSLPLPKPNTAQRKASCKKWPLPTFTLGSWSLRTGLQALNLIKIRRHEPLAPSRSVSQSCQVRGWCQGRRGDLVCGQADAPQGTHQMIAPHAPPMTPHYVPPAQTALPQPSSAPPASSSTQNII